MSKSLRRTMVRLLQISILAVGLFLLGFPEGQTVTHAAACYEGCVVDDGGDPGCAEWEPKPETYTGYKCELYQDYQWIGDMLILLDGCRELSCGS